MKAFIIFDKQITDFYDDKKTHWYLQSDITIGIYRSTYNKKNDVTKMSPLQ